jgi:hypothetical protein
VQGAEDRFAGRDEVDLALVAAVLRRSWRAALAGAIVVTLIELARLHGDALTYLVQMDVTPVMASDAEMAAAAVSPQQHFVQPKLGTTKSAALFDVYLQSLRSRAVADELAACPAVMKNLFRSEWDGAQNGWREHTGAFDRMRRAFQSMLGWPAAPWQPPGGAQMQRYLDRNLVVLRDSKEHLFATLELETSQPEVAQRLLILLHQAANDVLRPAAMSGENPPRSIAPAGCEAPDQSFDSVAAQILGAPSIRPDPTNTPLKSVLAALILGAAAGIACRLLVRAVWAQR